MPTVKRLSYRHPLTNEKKFLQTNIAIHGSAEKARKFLEDKRDVIIENLKNGVAEQISTKEELERPSLTTSDFKDKDDNKELASSDRQDMTENLMDMPVEATPEIDRIYGELHFSPFHLDMDITKTGYSCTIFGSSKSGKSYLLKHLLDKYISGKGVSILSAQNIHNDVYSNYPSDLIKTDTYSPILIKASARINKRLNNRYPFTFILDDIIDSKNDSRLESMYLTLRNSKVSIITLLQNVQLLKSTSRSNSNIIIFKKFNNSYTIENYIMKQYIGNYPPFKDLKMSDKVNLYLRIMNDGNYNFFVLDVLNNTLILCKGTDL